MTYGGKQHFETLANDKLYQEILVGATLIERALALYELAISHEDSSDLDGPFFFLSAKWKSDLMWISMNSVEMLRKAKLELFDLLDLSSVVSGIQIEEEVRCYNCFFLRRSTCHGYNWHKDFSSTNYQGFTIIVPLLAMQEETRGHLAYREHGKTKLYTYTLGRGIVFSDGFVHSPHPFEGEVPALFLCFTFGSDKEEYWRSILACLHTQSRRVCRYNGDFVDCREEYLRVANETL